MSIQNYLGEDFSKTLDAEEAFEVRNRIAFPENLPSRRLAGRGPFNTDFDRVLSTFLTDGGKIDAYFREESSCIYLAWEKDGVALQFEFSSEKALLHVKGFVAPPKASFTLDESGPTLDIDLWNAYLIQRSKEWKRRVAE